MRSSSTPPASGWNRSWAGCRPRPRAGFGIGFQRLPTVAVVGFPNVGKSTLVNRLVGGSEAVTAAEPGVTRDRKRLTCEWNGVAFELIDTGGIDLGTRPSWPGTSRARRGWGSPRPTWC